MSNELKLIKELCNALGFEVIEHREVKEYVRCEAGTLPPTVLENIEYELKKLTNTNKG